MQLVRWKAKITGIDNGTGSTSAEIDEMLNRNQMHYLAIVYYNKGDNLQDC